MSILQYTSKFAGQVNVYPRQTRLLSNDTYSTITALNYLAPGMDVLNGDFVLTTYGEDQELNATFIANVTTSGITLVASTTNNAGNIAAGSNGVAGYVASFPATVDTGSLRLTAVSNSGNYVVTISNAAMGQSSVVSIPDVAAATGQFLVKNAALVSGNIPQASGTAGLMVDSGVAANALRKFAQVALTAAQFNGMYATPVLLVAAPGANSMIVVESIELVMTYVSANYAAGGVVAAQYDSTANGAGVIASTTEAAADFFAAASTVFKMKGGLVLSPFTTCANKGLYLSNITQAFTTGDSTWIVKVFYHVISTTA
jgi:hypothetical protein